MESKTFKYNTEEPSFILSDDYKICQTCVNRKKDYINNGRVIIPGYNNKYCNCYKNGKPKEVLMHNTCSEYNTRKV